LTYKNTIHRNNNLNVNKKQQIMKKIKSVMLAVSFLFLLINIAFSQSNPKPNFLKREVKNQVFAIKNVNIITMKDGDKVLKNATVVVKNDKIESINDSIPKGAKIIDGKGKWLMPGLIDMHVHVPTDGGPFGPKIPTQAATVFFDLQDFMTLNNSNGVTTIFDLGSRPEHFGQRNEIAKGNVIGSRMALAAMIDGGKGQGRRANNAEEGRQAVRSAKAEGYEFIKLYSDLNIETFKAIVDEASKQKLKTIGHIPEAFEGHLKEAFVPNFGMVAHAEELTKHTENYSEADAKLFAKMLKENGTWLCPTLTTIVWIASQVRSMDEIKALPTLQYLHPLTQSKWLTANKYNNFSDSATIVKFENYVKFNNLLVKECKAIGVPIVAGTDASTSGVVFGFSMHDELELLVKAGLTNDEALNAATNLAATWLGIKSIVGTIEVGKMADLLLLEANPLDDIKNTKMIAGVFINGNWMDKSKIKADLADLSKRNTAAKADWDWKKMISGK
jgi:imidazolonepropionase-like amidohydrolase